MGRTIRITQELDSRVMVFQHPAVDRGGWRDKIRGALDHPSAGTAPAELVVSPAPPLHRFLP